VFLERKAISVKQTRFRGFWPDLSITIGTGNFLWWLVLALPVTDPRRIPTRFTTRRAYGHKIPQVQQSGGWRHTITLKVAPFHTEYNLGMADRIACSCVTCPKCGTWVVVSQSFDAGPGREKLRANCPAPECEKEFEFESGETRVFEVPLPLFERRHFFRSELN
jgi:hypothetical protein